MSVCMSVRDVANHPLPGVLETLVSNVVLLLTCDDTIFKKGFFSSRLSEPAVWDQPTVDSGRVAAPVGCGLFALQHYFNSSSMPPTQRISCTSTALPRRRKKKNGISVSF